MDRRRMLEHLLAAYHPGDAIEADHLERMRRLVAGASSARAKRDPSAGGLPTTPSETPEPLAPDPGLI